MAVVNISKSFTDSANKPGIYLDSKLKGFCLKVTSSGKKVYQVRRKVRGSQTNITVTINTHGIITAEQARNEAVQIIAIMGRGLNPNELKKQQNDEANEKQTIKDAEKKVKELTLERVFFAWLADAKKTKPNTKSLYKQVIFKHLQDWLNKPILEITPDMVRKRYEQVAAKTVASANNCFRALRMLFNWAIQEYEGELSSHTGSISNPVSVLSKRDKWQEIEARQDAIRDHDLKIWFQTVETLPNQDISDYFIFLLLTGLRKREAAGLRWRDVFLPEKYFVAKNTKNGRDHALPMTVYVFRLLKRRYEQRKSDIFVFPGSTIAGHIIDTRSYEHRIVDLSGVEFTPHALRRTFNLAASRSVPEYVVKSLMNHQRKDDVTQAHYGQLEAEVKREPLRLVEAFLLNLAGIEQPVASQDDLIINSKVVTLNNSPAREKRKVAGLKKAGS